MEFDKQTTMVASILTAGHMINTKMGIDDLEGAIKTYKEIGKEYEKRLKSYSEKQMKEGGFVEQPEELEIISAILTAGYVINTLHIEDVPEIMNIFEEFKDLYKNTENRAPLLLKTKTYLNVAAAIIIGGLIINTSDWEESPQETTFLYTQCMQKLGKF